MSALSQQNNKRIAKNTLLLYFRMLFSMGIGLFTSRIVLESLGIEDYGIYNLVWWYCYNICFLKFGYDCNFTTFYFI